MPMNHFPSEPVAGEGLPEGPDHVKKLRISQRLDGLDLARFLAFVGMVIVNFDVVMVSAELDSGMVASWFQGRAAATFVVLAGLGLGLGSAKRTWRKSAVLTLKRSMFLLVFGLLNTLVFSADIIHYYALYFLLGMFFLRVSNLVLGLTAAVLPALFFVLVLIFDYEKGWNWQSLSYEGFWTVPGFFRNLMFNGWHPVIPWLTFFLLGIGLSRLNLWQRKRQFQLVAAGLGMHLLAELASRILRTVAASWPDADAVFGTAPIPPMPLYMAAGCGVACWTIGLCLWMAPKLEKFGVLKPWTVPGRQTLTLYIAHILLGMGILEELAMLGNQPPSSALLAAGIFCVLASAFANVWHRFHKRGPLEALMRRLTG